MRKASFRFIYRNETQTSARVARFDNRLVVFAPAQTEFLTRDKTAVVAASAIVWRVAEPRRYFETVRNRQGAQARLNDIAFAELGAALGRHPLAAFVSTRAGDYRAESVLAEVAAKVREAARRDYGIEVVGASLGRYSFSALASPDGEVWIGVEC